MDLSSLRQFSDKYLSLLKGKYSFINLTRILDSEEFFNKQILDSVMPFQQVPELEKVLRGTKCLLDIGFGGGFPILPLAYCYPEFEFFGIEGRSRKVEVVKNIANDLGLKNVKLKTGRIEDYLINRDILITFKAVGTVKDCLMNIHIGAPICDIKVVFYKGPSFDVDESADISKLTQWKLIKKHQVEIPTTTQRHIVMFSHTKSDIEEKKSSKRQPHPLFPFAE